MTNYFLPIGLLITITGCFPLSTGEEDAELLKAVTLYASFDTAVQGDFGGGVLTLST